MLKKSLVVGACLLLMLAGCASTSRKSGSSGSGAQQVDLNPPATFYVEIASVPDDSPIYAIWDDYFTTVRKKLKPPPLAAVVRKKVTAALQYKGLVPKPAGQASLRVRASFDAKNPSPEAGDKGGQATPTKYQFKFHLAAFKAGGERPAWQGWSRHADTYQRALANLNALIVVVVTHWGKPSSSAERITVSDDNPLYQLLNRTP